MRVLILIVVALLPLTVMAQRARVDMVVPISISEKMGPISEAVSSDGDILMVYRVSGLPARTVDHWFPGDPPIQQRLTTLYSGVRVTKVNSTGVKLWDFDINAFHDNPNFGSTIYHWDIVVDNDGNSYVAVEFQGAVLIDTVIAGVFPQNGVYAVALFKLSPTGKPLWVLQFHTGGNPPNAKLAVEKEGDIAFTMSYTGSHHWWNTDITSSSHASLLARLAPDGNARWIRWYDASGGLWLQPAFAPDGEIAVVGHFHRLQQFGAITLEPRSYPGHRYEPTLYPVNSPGIVGPNCLLVVRYDRFGEVRWTRQVEGTGVQYGSVNPAAVAVDRNGDVIVAGYGDGMFFVDSSMIFSAAPEERGQPAQLILVRYNRDGTLLWTTRTKGNGTYYPYSVAIDSYGDVVVAGNIQGGAVVSEGSTQVWEGVVKEVPLLLAYARKTGKEIWGLVGGTADTKRTIPVEAGAGDFVADADGRLYLAVGYRGPLSLQQQQFEGYGAFVARIIAPNK